MKIHVKKKLYRLMCKEHAHKGQVNDANGAWITRPSGGNGMMRDYHPQRQ